MEKTFLPRPKVANVPASVVQQTISDAIGGLFETETVYCERHLSENEAVIVMMANGICATLHVQEARNAVEKGAAV